MILTRIYAAVMTDKGFQHTTVWFDILEVDYLTFLIPGTNIVKMKNGMNYYICDEELDALLNSMEYRLKENKLYLLRKKYDHAEVLSN